MRLTHYYKGIPVNSFGLPILWKSEDRIKSKNRKRKFYYLTFQSQFERSAPKNLIVIYDIPEEKKKERDWFRRQLKNLDYVMIQRSVWVGPSPLPQDFIDYVKMIGIKNQLKTFKLAKPYQKKSSKL